MNETSTTARRSRRAGQVAGSQQAGVDALQDGHAVVRAQPLVDLPAADVERGHVRRARLQEAVGEAAGRGADVEALEPETSISKAASAVASLSPPRETNAGPWSTSSAALSAIAVPAFVTTRPSTRTRPAITSAWARLRVSASPRSWSS